MTLHYHSEQPERLDKFLVSCLPDYSRSRLQGLIKKNLVWVNGVQAHKAGQMLERESEVDVIIPPPQPVDLSPEAIPLNVIFENEDLIVIDKPAGLVVHPAAGHFTGTLVHAVLGHSPEIEGIGGEVRPGVVHRLDKNTSGLILMAKNDAAHRWLQDRFRLHQVTKSYLALVDGKPPTQTGRIEAPIGRNPKDRKLMGIVDAAKGRQAVTIYRTIESFPKHSLVEAQPVTGRTHQIRIHLKFIGCPVVGDTIYGYRKPTLDLNRHFLHAARLSIQIPGEIEIRTFEAPLPPELVAVLSDLRTNR